MSRSKFTGIVCPMITPFKVDGLIYREGIKDLIDFLSGKSVNGLFICGTFGLGPALTNEERKKVAEYVMESLDNGLDVIVQVGSPNLDSTLELAKHAEDVGADAVASTPPFYYRYDDESILMFFQELVSHVNIPVFVYNIPPRVGYDISTQLLDKLIDVGVSGMKDSGNDILKSYEYMYIVREKKILCKDREFKFLIGTEALMLPAIVAGADGCVSGLSNIYPEAVVKLYHLIKNGRISEAVNMHFKVVKARRLIQATASIQLCYEALKLRGVDVGYPKPPLKRLPTQVAEELMKKLEGIGLLDDA